MISSKMILLLMFGWANRVFESWRKQNIFKKSAPFLITAGVGCLTPSFVEMLLDRAIASYDAMNGLKIDQSTDYLPFVGIFLVLVGVVFYIVSHYCKVEDVKEFIFDKKLYGPFEIGSAQVFCYSGSVTQISDIDVVVTSEDTDLNLGSLSGTSVSGRIRRMAATHNFSGVEVDHLFDWIQLWKKTNKVMDNFPLGTVVCLNESFNASSYGVKAIVFAVAIRKNPNRVATINKIAIDEIITKAFEFCKANNYQSIFVPVFGLGSGNASSKDALEYTLGAVCNYLLANNLSVHVYVGVYTFPDTIKVVTSLPRWVS